MFGYYVAELRLSVYVTLFLILKGLMIFGKQLSYVGDTVYEKE
jgi:hypothetical protein